MMETIFANVALAPLARPGGVCAGRLPAEADRPLLRAPLSGSQGERVVVLDCASVEVLTSSYFLGGPWTLWQEPDVFPVLANLKDADDVDLALRDRGEMAWLGTWQQGRFGHHRRIGAPLDSSLAQTLRRVEELGRASAADLHQMGKKVGLTGWSNRLASLYAHKLLRREKQGRQLIYFLSFVEIQNG